MGIGTRAARRRIGIATAASGVLAVAAAVTMTGTAGAVTAAKAAPSVAATPPSAGYQFVTLGSHHDRTFNQLLGINNEGVIAGYFGSGAKGHANKGYQILPPYSQGDIVSENFPHSAQTQVTGLNDRGVTVGFFSTQNTASMSNNNFGWWASGGHFHEVNFPTGTPSAPPVDQLLGVNNHDVAVGFFTNASGLNRGYTYNINTKTFSRVLVPGASGLGPNLTATAINNHGDVAGFFGPSTSPVSFLKLANGNFFKFTVKGATMTQAFGVNDSDWVVGTYTDGPASSPTTHGFLWRPGSGFILNIDDPNGIGTTVLNGINDENDLVGFYTDGGGNVDGLLAYPPF